MAETYLTAAQATARLGVKAATLYAYVSRGLLRTTQAVAPARGSLYAAADVERLFARSQARRGHGAAAFGALRWGEPVLDSAITQLKSDSVAYRGIPVTELLHATFEAVAELLWTGILPASVAPWSPPRRGAMGSEREHTDWLMARRGFGAKGGDAAASQSRESRLLAYGIARYALSDPEGADDQLDETLKRSRSLIGLLAGRSAGAAKGQRSPPVSISEAMLNLFADGKRPVAQAAAQISACNAALILSADHELNSSSFAARVAASTGADLYACHLAGCSTLSGPLHGGALGRFEALVAALPSGRRLDSEVHALLKSKDGITGFGHPLYPNGDPRTPPLLERAAALAGHTPQMQKILRVVQLVREATGAEPSVDVGLVAIATALGYGRGQGSRCLPSAAPRDGRRISSSSGSRRCSCGQGHATSVDRPKKKTGRCRPVASRSKGPN